MSVGRISLDAPMDKDPRDSILCIDPMHSLRIVDRLYEDRGGSEFRTIRVPAINFTSFHDASSDQTYDCKRGLSEYW